MLELAERMLEHGEDSNRLFLVLANTLYAMEKNGLEGQAALSYFFVQALDIMGVFPALDFCAVCGKAVPVLRDWYAAEGGAVCASCSRGFKTRRVPAGLAEHFRAFRDVRPRDIGQLRETGIGNALVLSVAEEYLRQNAEIKLRTMKYITA
jgi:DNA repair protein RecO